MKITIQYFEGCPHWTIAETRLRRVLRDLSIPDVNVEHQVIESPAHAARVGFHGSPSILVDGSDPFATGTEPEGMTCRVYATEEGWQGAPTELQLRTIFTRDERS
ncbi:MAG: thioredoxin family protein [Chloroflexi bacterium]|nr:MAG: thioredoxin family protein [Chloroflexota bacterium]TMG14196.1 MAG: thioredoxin family protein [Chloroflexota bacterium]